MELQRQKDFSLEGDKMLSCFFQNKFFRKGDGIMAKKTPLYEEHLKAGGKVVDYAGWYLPVEYKGLVAEHEAVRNRVGMFDVSHMGEVTLLGKDARKFADYLTTNNIKTLDNGRVIYGFLCMENGGEVGALEGPSIMPGGSAESYQALGPILEDISAKVDGEPCCTYIGTDGAGHFVKMVHNGIEYADMQFMKLAVPVQWRQQAQSLLWGELLNNRLMLLR